MVPYHCSPLLPQSPLEDNTSLSSPVFNGCHAFTSGCAAIVMRPRGKVRGCGKLARGQGQEMEVEEVC